MFNERDKPSWDLGQHKVIREEILILPPMRMTRLRDPAEGATDVRQARTTSFSPTWELTRCGSLATTSAMSRTPV